VARPPIHRGDGSLPSLSEPIHEPSAKRLPLLHLLRGGRRQVVSGSFELWSLDQRTEHLGIGTRPANGETTESREPVYLR